MTEQKQRKQKKQKKHYPPGQWYAAAGMAVVFGGILVYLSGGAGSWLFFVAAAFCVYKGVQAGKARAGK